MIIKTISKWIEEALDLLQMDSNEVRITKSNRPDLCDYQYDGAFQLAKIYHQNPIEIGEKIIEVLTQNLEIQEKTTKIECIRPGFINITLSESFINEQLNKMTEQEKFNILLPKKEKIVIDYGGPNVAKPLHIGHLRSAIVGESIKRILRFMNQEVVADVHLGDYGLQIGQVIYGLLQESISPNEITLDILERIYPQISGLCKENEEVKEQCAKITKELQTGNPEYQAYFRHILEISKKDIKRIYDFLGVSFDLWNGESDSYPYIPKLTQELEQQNLIKISDGAKIIEVGEETDKKEIPPLIYQKSDGGYLYGTTDLATVYERKINYNPDKILYVVDLRQSLHFHQVFRVCKKFDSTKELQFEFLGFGTVNGKDGKPYKTRSGSAPKLDNLFLETKDIFLSKKEENKHLKETDLNKIVNAIIKFADLQNNREKDYIFDMNKFSDVLGKTGPYILYTYLRVDKIVKQHQTLVDSLSETIYNKQDRELRIKLLDLENIVNYAYQTRLPSVIANYLYELCVLVNAFYEKNHINNLEEKRKQKDWVTLLNLTTKVIQTMLDLLVIEIPSEM